MLEQTSARTKLRAVSGAPSAGLTPPAGAAELDDREREELRRHPVVVGAAVLGCLQRAAKAWQEGQKDYALDEARRAVRLGETL